MGGFFGYLNAPATISNCTDISTINGYAGDVGGIIAYLD